MDSSQLDLPADKKEGIRDSIAQKEKQTIRKIESSFLLRQRTDGLFCSRVTGEQNTNGSIQGEYGKAHGHSNRLGNPAEEKRQNTGSTPKDRRICQIVFVGSQVTP